MSLKDCLITVALAAGLVLPSASLKAQEKLQWRDLISPDSLVQFIMINAISVARSAGDIRYHSLDTNLAQGHISVHDINFQRAVNTTNGNLICDVDIGRVVLRLTPLSGPSTSRMVATADDIKISPQCLPTNMTHVPRLLGMGEMSLPRVHIDVSYDHPSGGADLLTWVDVTDIGILTLQADFDYLSYVSDSIAFRVQGKRARYYASAPLSFDLSNAHISFDDAGAWKTLARIGGGEQAVNTWIASQIKQKLEIFFMDINPAPVVVGTQADFIEDVLSTWARFVAAPERIVLETDIETPVRLDAQSLEKFHLTFNALNPQVSTQGQTPANVLPLEMLSTALTTPDMLSPEDQRRAGLAFLTGLGAPKNQAAAQNLLEPLAFNGDAEVAFALAQATQETHPEAAYGLALIGAKGGIKGSLSLASDLENTIDLTSMIEIQNSFQQGEDFAIPDFDSLAAMRKAALDRQRGTQFTRNYMAAFYMASFGAAAGDRASFELLKEIEDLMRRRGDLAEWNVMTQDLSNQVLTDWIARDMPTILRAE